jgi:hypothetical protein
VRSSVHGLLHVQDGGAIQLKLRSLAKSEVSRGSESEVTLVARRDDERKDDRIACRSTICRFVSRNEQSIVGCRSSMSLRIGSDRRGAARRVCYGSEFVAKYEFSNLFGPEFSRSHSHSVRRELHASVHRYHDARAERGAAAVHRRSH